MDAGILERDAPLASLADWADKAADGAGCVVLVSGEAGIGKSTLVRAFGATQRKDRRWLTGYCDDLATPRVLGPLRDLRGELGPELTRALVDGDRFRAAEALRDELAEAGRPTVLVIEDVHWIDEATLDVLRFLVPRLAVLPAALVLTYRDDELTPDHPLRHLLGLVSRAANLHRIRLERLSPAAVRQLSTAAAVDPDRVYGVTSGNPYFVAEVLASGDSDAVPLTIADAVNARLLPLSAEARTLIERLSVVPSAVERWLVDALSGPGSDAVEVAERRGLVTATGDRVAFRHELTRRAVLDGMPSSRRIAAHARVLEELLQRDGVDVSRIVHHAAGAGDRDSIITHGPRAAHEAVAAGAHRQAAAHLRLVLDQRPDLDPAAEADLWEAYGVECYTINTPADVSREALVRAAELRRTGEPDPVALAGTLRWLSRVCWWEGDTQAARQVGDEAIAVLTGTGHDADLAMLYSNQSQLLALAGREEEAVEKASRALELGSDVPATRSHALNNLGLARSRSSHAAGRPVLVESLEVALAGGEIEHACRSYVNIIWQDMENLQLDTARTLLADGIRLAERAEVLVYAHYFQFMRGLLMFALGEWDGVVAAASQALDSVKPFRCGALVLIGRLQARRGEPGAIDLLNEAWDLAQEIGECQRIGPAAAALADAAWLAGDPAAALPQVRTAYDLALRCGTVPVRAELAYWLGVASGSPVDVEGDHPYALLAKGQWREAAQRWREAGSAYEAALAMTHGTDEAELLDTLATLDGLGAEPLATMLRATLRMRGVSRVPRGPAPSTRANPAGLTDRQLAVVALVAEGLTNAEIAGQLVLSVRTVDSHVAATFDKLGVRSRREAVTRARELGIVTR